MTLSPILSTPPFGKSVRQRIDDLPLKTYQKLKRVGVQLLGASGAVKGTYSLTMGYMDEYQSGLHMAPSLCAPKVGREDVIDQILPWLPCHVSLLDLLLLGGGLVAVFAPKRVLYIGADLKERIPHLAQQGAKKAKAWAKKLRSGS